MKKILLIIYSTMVLGCSSTPQKSQVDIISQINNQIQQYPSAVEGDSFSAYMPTERFVLEDFEDPDLLQWKGFFEPNNEGYTRVYFEGMGKTGATIGIGEGRNGSNGLQLETLSDAEGLPGFVMTKLGVINGNIQRFKTKEAYFIPENIKANRLEFWVRFKKGFRYNSASAYPPSDPNHQNFEIRTSHFDPSKIDGATTVFESDNWHFYHQVFLRHDKLGVEWMQVIVNAMPQKQLNSNSLVPNDPTMPAGNYYNLLTQIQVNLIQFLDPEIPYAAKMWVDDVSLSYVPESHDLAINFLDRSLGNTMDVVKDQVISLPVNIINNKSEEVCGILSVNSDNWTNATVSREDQTDVSNTESICFDANSSELFSLEVAPSAAIDTVGYAGLTFSNETSNLSDSESTNPSMTDYTVEKRVYTETGPHDDIVSSNFIKLKVTDGTTTADSGTTTTDSGSTTTDSGSTTADSGTTTTDSGSTTADSGTTTTDSGSTTADSGTTTTDSGSTTADSGTTTTDSGSTTADSGTTTTDSGSTTADSGTTTTDSGSTTADSGSTTTGGTTTSSSGSNKIPEDFMPTESYTLMDFDDSVLHDEAWLLSQPIGTAAYYVKNKGKSESVLSLAVGQGRNGSNALLVDSAKSVPSIWMIKAENTGQNSRLTDERGYGLPSNKRANRLEFWVKFEDGFKYAESSSSRLRYPNHENFHVGTYQFDPSLINGSKTVVESDGWHFYHMLYLRHDKAGSGWIHVIVNPQPQHQRNNHASIPNNPTMPAGNYWELLTRFYLQVLGADNGHSKMWVDDIRLSYVPERPDLTIKFLNYSQGETVPVNIGQNKEFPIQITNNKSIDVCGLLSINSLKDSSHYSPVITASDGSTATRSKSICLAANSSEMLDLSISPISTLKIGHIHFLGLGFVNEDTIKSDAGSSNRSLTEDNIEKRWYTETGAHDNIVSSDFIRLQVQ